MAAAASWETRTPAVSRVAMAEDPPAAGAMVAARAPLCSAVRARVALGSRAWVVVAAVSGFAFGGRRWF
jgi:hypothetical protein